MVSTLPRPARVRADPPKCGAPGTNMPPSLPPAATIAATAAITSARSCLYHSFSSVPPLPFLRVQSTLHLSSSLVLLFTPQFQAQPPFHDDPNTPSIPLRCMSPWAAARTHDLLILLAATSLSLTTPICIAFLGLTTTQDIPQQTQVGQQGTIWGGKHSDRYNGRYGIPKCTMQNLGLLSAARRNMSLYYVIVTA